MTKRKTKNNLGGMTFRRKEPLEGMVVSWRGQPQYDEQYATTKQASSEAAPILYLLGVLNRPFLPHFYSRVIYKTNIHFIIVFIDMIEQV